MKNRRQFIPAAPNFASLEDRIAPSNLFGLGSRWDKMVDKLGLSHRSHHASHTANLQQAEPAGVKVAHHVVHASAKSPAIFK